MGFCYHGGMSWSITRQLLFALGALLVVSALGAFVYFSFFFTPATCSDGVQNSAEEGVDCGGSCARLCVAPNLSTVWARSVPVAPGVYHAVAQIKNPDTAAAGSFAYTVSLYDAENILITERRGTFGILPGEVATLFEANLVTGERVPTRTFVDIGPGTFSRAERGSSPVRTVSFELDETRPRLAVVIENQSLFPVRDVVVTALLFNNAEVVTSASQTMLDFLAPRERREVLFTWQEPFSELPQRVEVVPRVVAP